MGLWTAGLAGWGPFCLPQVDGKTDSEHARGLFVGGGCFPLPLSGADSSDVRLSTSGTYLHVGQCSCADGKSAGPEIASSPRRPLNWPTW